MWPPLGELPALLLPLLVGAAGAVGANSVEEEGLLDLLGGQEVEVLPPGQFDHLEDKIPGLKDGMFKSPKDGEWKKVKSISKISDNKGKTEDLYSNGLKKVKSMKKIKQINKIKSMTQIDEDLALKMKKEVEEGNNSLESSSQRFESADVEDTESNESSLKEEVTPDLLSKVERVLKMFNASSLDDIIEVTPIKSMHPLVEGSGLTSKLYLPLFSDEVSSWSGEDSRKLEESMALPLSRSLEDGSRKVRRLEAGLQGKVDQLEEHMAALEKEKALQGVLARMLLIQQDKVAKIKELIDDHKEKEMRLLDIINKLNELVGEEKERVMDHLDRLKSVADEVHNQEMDRINSFTEPYSKARPIFGQQLEESKESTLPDLPELQRMLGLKTPIKRARKISSMKKIKQIDKIKSIVGLTKEQAGRLARWQRERLQKLGYNTD